MLQVTLKLTGIFAVVSFLAIACGGGDVPTQAPQNTTAPPDVSFGQPGGPIPPHAFVGTVTVDGATAVDGTQAVPYTHLTLPTICSVELSMFVVSLK